MPEKCKFCEKEFNSVFSLNAHLKDKHHITEFNEKKYGKIIFYFSIIFIIVFVVMVIAYISKIPNSCKTADARDLILKEHTQSKLHIHTDLEIIINGKKQEIPTNIGVIPEGMRPVHTHDFSGHIHIEGPCVRDFTLGDFFNIWEKQFNNKCIFDNCVTNNESLKMYVDSKENFEFENLIFIDGQKIVIEYKS